MWQFLVRFILRNRLFILITIGILTILMGYLGSKIKMSYEMARMLPSSDPINIEYENFKKQFGLDGNVIFVAIQDPKLYTLDHFNSWYDLSNEVLEINGIQEVVSVARLYNLLRNDSLKKFQFLPIVSERLTTQREVDSVRSIIYSLPFYDGRLFNKETDVNLMMITLDKEVLNSKARVGLVKEIKERNVTSLAITKLATGVGGLDWEDVKPVIEKHLSDLDVPVYVYEKYQKQTQGLES